MEYKYREIEKKWQDAWKESGIYEVSNASEKPKYYVLDMFPYPSGAGLHVGHPLGYIASDIFARYKRLKGFNVLHPMGFDSFGLPAEQYAIETGQHPATTTENNIATFKGQLDKIGFSYDWSREVRTSDPSYYRWTQWIFLQLFESWYNHTTDKAESLSTLIEEFKANGSVNVKEADCRFTAEEWNQFDEKKQQEILMQFRLAFSSFGEVNWCEALGTVLANDEVVNGVSERGGHPVEKKKMRQWYLRITDYADRLLKGLETVNFSDAMKEMQRNWIGKSEGAEMVFEVSSNQNIGLTPSSSPKGEGGEETPLPKESFQTGNKQFWPLLKDLSRENRKDPTPAEDKLWQALRNNQLETKVRRQHVIDGFIIDFAFLNEKLLIEVDGEYHDDPEQKKYDDSRTEFLESLGYKLIRFSNDEVEKHFQEVKERIKSELVTSPLSGRRGVGGEAKESGSNHSIKVYTTRPDTIFGVDFLVLAPEHELVKTITTPEQQSSINDYLQYVKSRSDRERQSEVKQITGCFTGAYALNPFNGKQIPIWIAEYVLAGYGTGAIMAVPCGDQRDFLFAKHFNIPITNIIGEHYTGNEANPTKDAILENSGFLNGMKMKDAMGVAMDKIVESGLGKRKINYRMRDAGFSRQRYWGEPFPIIWSEGIAIPLSEDELPLELPHVEKYGPGKEGEGPLSNLKEWILTPVPSPQVERGEASPPKNTSGVPKYNVSSPMQYELAKSMRKDYTEAEDKLWQQLRNNKLGVKFRRQHPIESYIADFISLQNKLIIEVDGGYHENEEQKIYDEERTKVLNEIGFQVVRYSNEEILNNVFEIIKKIKKIIHDTTNNIESNELAPSPFMERGLGVRETSTMPGYAGSSWYFLRYMDPHNNETFADRKATDYWNQVDVYIGGTEHAVGHLLYSRLWTKVLYDLGHIGFDEPFKKLVNQGMIQGSSRFVYRVKDSNKFVSAGLKSEYETSTLHVDVNMVNGVELDIQEFKKWRNAENANAEFVLENGKYICGVETEKMSKSKFNTVNPDDLVDRYGADTFRMYEMFLGPVEQSKPWDTKGIEGVHRFLKKFWRLFYDDIKEKIWTEEKATPAELKVLHKTIKKIEDDTERFSFNTSVSGFMVAVNELADLKSHKREILEPLLILLTPYAPHISEELYHALGNEGSVLNASFPVLEKKYLVEAEKEYPISINGKLRTTITISLDAPQDEVEKIVLENEIIQKWVDGKTPKKIIYVKGKMVNVVV